MDDITQIVNEAVNETISQTNIEAKTEVETETGVSGVEKSKEMLYNSTDNKEEDGSKHIENEVKQKENAQDSYKVEYWNKTIPIVSKEIGLSEDDVKMICEGIGLDSPDAILELRRIIMTPIRTVIVDEIQNEKPKPKEIAKDIKSYDWLKIAEIIKKDRRLL